LAHYRARSNPVTDTERDRAVRRLLHELGGALGPRRPWVFLTRNEASGEIALLVRHRWLGDASRETYRCTRGVPSVYVSPDPICFGCGAEIAWCDVRGIDRYRGVVSRSRIMGEDLGVRLDLRLAERAMEAHRATA
jgi:hypothetical protein